MAKVTIRDWTIESGMIYHCDAQVENNSCIECGLDVPALVLKIQNKTSEPTKQTAQVDSSKRIAYAAGSRATTAQTTTPNERNVMDTPNETTGTLTEAAPEAATESKPKRKASSRKKSQPKQATQNLETQLLELLKSNPTMVKGLIAQAQGGNTPTPENTDDPNFRVVASSQGKEGFCDIHFDSKPGDLIRQELKDHGFRWSGFNRCWYGRAALLASSERFGEAVKPYIS